ncbi:MAG: ABC transporter permease [Bdellovibrionaceae bacterium]|nr:ABC transporter permease [Pseudobdellovibrionaceae bacterium]MBX3034322.1 ABC transporter permease [Pseudobdellovibrionaceae bacterium]
MKRFLPPVIAFVLLVAFLEMAAAFEWVNPSLIPPPSQVLASLLEQAADFRQAFFETARNTALGYLLACLGGFALALIFSLNEWLRRAILPFAIFFQTVPIIAIAPLLVIYFGFGGGTVIAAAAIVAVFPVLANTLLGLESVDPGELELFRLYGASSWQRLWKLKIPKAYVSIYGGLKIAAGLAVIGSVAGEFVAGGGLGAMIDSARTQQRIDLVFGALLLLSFLGLLLIGSLQLLNFFVNRVRPYGLHLKD